MIPPLSLKFSHRIVAHKDVARQSDVSNKPLVLAVRNHLLVATKLEHDVANELKNVHNIVPVKLTTLFDGLQNPHGISDVTIYELPPEQLQSTGMDIFHLAASLRQTVNGGNVPANEISPNHILVPAQLDHCCPWGPPSPAPGIRAVPPRQGPSRNITVIDAGYQWNPAWGANPLGGSAQVVDAERLPLSAGSWRLGLRDTPGENVPGVPGRLLALAGHANFVAGVIAQRSPHAKITIRNHNGSFDPDSDDFPTEATVARSLCKSAEIGVVSPSLVPSIVNLGFAFAAAGNQVSAVWERSFEYIRRGNEAGPLVVSPAGNQFAPGPYFPAALSHAFPGAFDEMIGVTSIDVTPGASPTRSGFSNAGPWVTCSTIGTNVRSTFLHVNMALEESATDEVFNFESNSWATWNGTSFATPKVVAGVCAQLAGADGDPIKAWKNLAATGIDNSQAGLGLMFPQLG